MSHDGLRRHAGRSGSGMTTSEGSTDPHDLERGGDAWERLLPELRAARDRQRAQQVSDTLATIGSLWTEVDRAARSESRRFLPRSVA